MVSQRKTYNEPVGHLKPSEFGFTHKWLENIYINDNSRRVQAAGFPEERILAIAQFFEREKKEEEKKITRKGWDHLIKMDSNGFCNGPDFANRGRYITF